MTQILPGVTYEPCFIALARAVECTVFAQCERDFVQRTGSLYGRSYKVPRLEAWYGSKPYKFNGAKFAAKELPPILALLRSEIEKTMQGVTFDGCLVNLYRDGQDSVSWHSDDELDMGDPVVASISLGATRRFRFRAKADHTNQAMLDLASGSLLVMGRGVQRAYEHCLPRCANAGRRLNLTFRAPG